MQSIDQLLQKIGRSPKDKLLIIHADDMGLCHSENQATIEAFQKNSINSSSIMIPSPWAREAVQFSIDNPKLDIGLHVTLTCEWKNYKWKGISDAKGLVDTEGYFYSKNKMVLGNATTQEIYEEIEAQIMKALSMGFRPSHMDSHMACLYENEAVIDTFVSLSEKHKIPLMLPLNVLSTSLAKKYKNHPSEYAIPVENAFFMDRGVSADQWTPWYVNKVNALLPGLNTMLIHVGYDNAELQGVCIDHPDFGSEWRQRDLDLVNSDDFKQALKSNNVQLITWQQIKAAI